MLNFHMLLGLVLGFLFVPFVFLSIHAPIKGLKSLCIKLTPPTSYSSPFFIVFPNELYNQLYLQENKNLMAFYLSSLS